MATIQDSDEITQASDSQISEESPRRTRASMESSLNVPLTVDRKWKVEDELVERMSLLDGPSRVVPVAKWIFTILIAIAITCLFVATKISFVFLSLALNTTAPPTEPGSHDPKHVSQFLVVFLTLEVPYFLLFLRTAWVGLFSQVHRWPGKKAVLCGLVTGVLEPLGLVMLALKVLPKMSLSLGVLVLSNVIALAIFVETIKFVRQRGRSAVNMAMIASCVLMLAGLGMTGYMVYNHVQDSAYMLADIAHAVSGVACLSIAWLPRLLRHITQPPTGIEEITEGHFNGSVSVSLRYSEETLSSDTTDLNLPQNTVRMTRLPGGRRHVASSNNKDVTWKSSLILYGVKTAGTLVFSFIFFYVDSPYLQDNFAQASYDTFISAWNFDSTNIMPETWMAFGVNLIGGLLCYILAFIAAHTNMQRGCLAVPFILSLPLTVSLSAVHSLCDTFIGIDIVCRSDSTTWYYLIGATASITIAQTLSLGRYAFRKERIHLQKEEQLFWIPGYSGALSDAWLLLDTRQTIKEGRVSKQANPKAGRTRVYICTTMYREDKSEMQQLLESLAKINFAKAQGETFFESHIIFDGGVKQRKLSEFSLTLISLLEETLSVSPVACTKIITPYGMKLSWGLPTLEGKTQMTFNIHLKDNTVVKNKKRWSQIMYMSYVLDFLSGTACPDEELYILTTDADVMFTPESVESLLDLMCRDPSVGAVCARTHPMGSGPLVWYQIFEYAVGHWFQKASEHVLGSVLCAPGCFSVYRCRALRDILPKYCKKVENSFDFLTKDMGEDRWLCTLMVQSGWRIEYCAASENSTNCPSEFEEFFKQRRRWIASTLANLMLIIKEWKYIALFNQRVSVVFLMYQVLLLFSTLISPSTVILVVSGGLVFAWNINAVAAVLLQVILCILFAMVCILTAPKTHIIVAKVYTFLYAVVMCAVAVGTAEQIVEDLSTGSGVRPGNMTVTSTPKPSDQHINKDIPVSMTTVYFAFLISIFFLAGLLHPREITCLFHGICFLICIPSAYLVLMIYSICNLTDSSWGTREAETTTSTIKKTSWIQLYKKAFYSIFFCLASKSKPSKGVDAETQTTGHHLGRHSSIASYPATPSTSFLATQPMSLEADDTAASRLSTGEYFTSGEWQRHADYAQEEIDIDNVDVPISVDDWLPPDFKSNYAEIFKRHGFDSTLFIKGLKEADLNRMGITKRGHVQFLMAEISMLPAFEIEYKVPTDVRDWLQEIGLAQYSSNFRRNRIRTAKEMEILKKFNRNEIEKELGITKEGHVKRLQDAIRMLRDPSDSQQKSNRMRQAIDETPVHLLNELNPAEYEFWKRLRATCLEPDLKAFGIDAEVNVKLVELRNNWLLVMAVANTLWLIVITTLATKGNLTLLGANPVGLLFLFIFGFLFVVQFLAMIVHRLSTLSHYVARAPYTFGRPYQTNWSFNDKAEGAMDDLTDVTAFKDVKLAAASALKRAAMGPRKKVVNYTDSTQPHINENTPLINSYGPSQE